MKNTFKKLTSAILATAIGVLSFSAANPAYATDEPMVINVVTDGTSEYGFQPYRYVDENGNEVVLGRNKAETFGEGNNVIIFDNSGADCSLTASSLPASYDSRDKGFVTDVKYQGDGGNCWSYASISMMESSSIINGFETAETADYSEAHLTWFAGKGLAEDTEDMAYGDGFDLESPYYYGGNWRRAAATFARWSGVADESEFPAYPRNISAMGNYAESDRYNTSAGVVLESAQQLSGADDVKQWIVENGSATAAYYHGSTNYNSKTSAYCCLENKTINHMITIIGWDDDYSAENFSKVPSADGAWLCKNSWGTGWGDKGCFWISYADANLLLFAGFTARSSENCYKNYTYNGSEWNSALGMSGKIQVANVFTASSHEKLTAVAVQTAGTNNSTKIMVYKNLADGCTTPIAGTLASTTSIVLKREGYHTIYLDEAVSLEPGETFSVVAEYSNLDTGVTYFPVEKKTVEYQTYGSREGESFINLRATKYAWQPASKYEVNNVYVQAFTECEHSCTTETELATCTENGVETVYCTQCGKVESETVVSHTGHTFGTWSQFEKNSKGEEISTRSCMICGITETRLLSQMNVVTADNLFNMFFTRFVQIFRSLFSK